jgi:hypothetical protein
VKSPVAFFIYKRPECTRRVWAEICRAKPPVLLLVADGPRDEQDRVQCETVRTIVESVKWPCDVRRNYAGVNMGCRGRMSSGLNWVFQQVEEAIILEDDCLPTQVFFAFCDELLAHYRSNDRVMHISGDNFQDGKRRSLYDYYFSKYPHVWGWATWRRAWRHYDLAMSRWPGLRDRSFLEKLCPDKCEKEYWTSLFDRSFQGGIDTWDYAWTFACWAQGGMSILPERNLVENIGFGPDATHTSEGRRGHVAIDGLLKGELRHPEIIAVNTCADGYTFKNHYNPPISFQEWMRRTVLNRYWYGRWVRQTPVLSSIWVRIRHGRK